MINVGDKAPEVLGINEKGEEIRLSAYKGKKIVLYFYPKDSTSGCTAQACNLRDNYSELRKAGYEVIGVSVDNEKSHQKFIEKNNLPFTLIADTDKKLVEEFGVWGEKKLYGRAYMGTFRTTFLINEEGIVERIINGKYGDGRRVCKSFHTGTWEDCRCNPGTKYRESEKRNVRSYHAKPG